MTRAWVAGVGEKTGERARARARQPGGYGRGKGEKEKGIREGRCPPIRSLRDAGTINFRAGSATAGKQRIDAELQALEAVADIL